MQHFCKSFSDLQNIFGFLMSEIWTQSNLIAIISDVDEFLTVEQPQQVLHGIEVFTTQTWYMTCSDLQQHTYTGLKQTQETQQVLHGIEVFATQWRYVQHSNVQQHSYTDLKHVENCTSFTVLRHLSVNQAADIKQGRNMSVQVILLALLSVQIKLQSTGYSTLPSPPRLMRRAVVARRTHTQTPSVTIPSPLAKQWRR